MTFTYRLLLLTISVLLLTPSRALEPVDFKNGRTLQIDGINVEYCLVEGEFSPDSLGRYTYTQAPEGVINFGSSLNPVVLHFTVRNLTDDPEILLYLPIPYFDDIRIFTSGNASNTAKFEDPYPGGILQLQLGEQIEVYVYVRSTKQYVLPIQLARSKVFTRNKNNRNLLFGGFVGIMLCMFLYNLALAFYTRDRNYFYYICYIVTIMLAQIGFMGINYYMRPGNIQLTNGLMFIGSSGAGIFGALFALNFLKIKFHLRKVHRLYQVIIFLYVLVLLLYLANELSLSYQVIQLAGLFAALVTLYAAITLSIRGLRSAKIYLAAWAFLIMGLVAYAIKDFGIIPTTNFSNFSFPLGVIIETILLSIALADQINTLKKDNEKAQERIIEEMSRNENLIKDQNILLEEKVKKRTEELETTLQNLKQAQVKLIESEKMASLGLLTAGIAHEINNPINYVTANVIPLRENIDFLTQLLNKYKSLGQENFEEQTKEIVEMEKEIDLAYTLKETAELIDGIEEGAKRTYTIVDGLRTFSRSDKSDKKLSNVNKGVRSTLAVLKSQLRGITMNVELDESLPDIHCQLGKLNQVFLNLINNALQSIELRYGELNKKGVLHIRSYRQDNRVIIEVEDNGTGISKQVIGKIFEPFYTSKPVGEGTGLGLSISYSIVEDHHGTLRVQSEEGQGATFTIELPIEP